MARHVRCDIVARHMRYDIAVDIPVFGQLAGSDDDEQIILTFINEQGGGAVQAFWTFGYENLDFWTSGIWTSSWPAEKFFIGLGLLDLVSAG